MKNLAGKKLLCKGTRSINYISPIEVCLLEKLLETDNIDIKTEVDTHGDVMFE
jgi:hypothetical protein